VGILERHLAIGRAREVGMDLVEVAPQADPPVCRIMDYGKWVYEQKRRLRENRKKTVHHVATLKEIRLRPETDKHDLEIKVNRARGFLQKGHRVQFTMLFRGRQMLHRDKGYEVLNKITESLTEVAKTEQIGRMTGRRMIMMLAPTK